MKFSLRTLLIVPFLVQVIGITALVGYLSYRSGQRAVRDLARQLMVERSQQAKGKLETYLQLPRLVTQFNADLMQAGTLNSADLALLDSHLIAELKRFPQLSGLAMTNEAGGFLNIHRMEDNTFTLRQRNVNLQDGVLYRYRADASGQTATLIDRFNHTFNPHRDPPDNPWYPAAKANPNGVWRLVVSLQRGENDPRLVLVRFVPVYGASGQVMGVFSAGILLTEIGHFLQELMATPPEQAFLVEPDGHLVATSTGELPFNPEVSQDPAQNVAVAPRRFLVSQSRNRLTQAAALQIQGQNADFSHIRAPQFSELRVDGQHYFVNATPIQDDLNWLLVTVIPSAAFMDDISTNLTRTVLLCALALLGSIGLGIWTAEYITKPILSLQQATQAFTDGMAVVPPTQPTQIKEVEALRQRFDQMVGQLVASFSAQRDRETTLATFLNGVPLALSIHDPTG
ncbi:MAG: hypothetical protein HC929_11910, partial [Leptolyngbyaceae cyanobacterium SM2_5_2]|nr:hypothetical protein [Leptolyngbyaceae cyanobacterium SM2_5_2]